MTSHTGAFGRRRALLIGAVCLGAGALALATAAADAGAAVKIDRANSSRTLIPGERAAIQSKVNKGNYCRLTATRPGSPRSASAARRATSSEAVFSWRVTNAIRAGKWTITVRCAPTKRAVLRNRGAVSRVTLKTQRIGAGRRAARVGGGIQVRFIAPVIGDGKGGDVAPAATPGWATGGTPSNPDSQRQADEKYAAAECADNTALIFRVRGSGEDYNKDKLGHWTYRLGEDLIAKGWRVRDMQAIYSAPKVPFWDAFKGLAASPLTTSGALSLIPLRKAYERVRDFRDAATRESDAVYNDIVRAYRRCKKRSIFIAGYSQGGIVLRYVIPYLPHQTRAMITRIDLVADPTTDISVDTGFDTSRENGLSIRTVRTGSDTASGQMLGARNLAGVFVSGAKFKQRPYPTDVRGRTTQFCLPFDVVCEASVVNLRDPRFHVHSQYDFAGIGARAASFAKTWNTPPPPNTGTVEAPGPGSTTTPNTPVPPTTTQPPSGQPVAPPTPTTPPPATRTYPQQQATRGVNTFTNPYNASGMGPRIEPRTWVEVSCKVYAPQIVSANPDGYWYRIASAPWNNAYYSPANTFWNGDVEGQKPYTHNTDWNVPDC